MKSLKNLIFKQFIIMSLVLASLMTNVAVGEVSKVDPNLTDSLTIPVWDPVSVSPKQDCSLIQYITTLQDGQYYINSKVIDTQGRKSILGTDGVPKEYWSTVEEDKTMLWTTDYLKRGLTTAFTVYAVSETGVKIEEPAFINKK